MKKIAGLCSRIYCYSGREEKRRGRRGEGLNLLYRYIVGTARRVKRVMKYLRVMDHLSDELVRTNDKLFF